MTVFFLFKFDRLISNRPLLPAVAESFQNNIIIAGNGIDMNGIGFR